MAKKKADKTGEQQAELEFEPESLEKALLRLEEIVTLMDSESVGLEKSMELFQEGMKLSRYCRKEISTAEQKVQKIIEDATGDLSVEDLEHE
jgi:exodeoxyribonuclease VII small subunit